MRASHLTTVVCAGRDFFIGLILFYGYVYTAYKYGNPFFARNDFFRYEMMVAHPFDFSATPAPFVLRQIPAIVASVFYRLGFHSDTAAVIDTIGLDGETKRRFFAMILSNALGSVPELHRFGRLPSDQTCHGRSDQLACTVWNSRRLVLFPERGDCAGDNRPGMACEFAPGNRPHRSKRGNDGPNLCSCPVFARNYTDLRPDDVPCSTAVRARPQARRCCFGHRVGGELFALSGAADWLYHWLCASDRSDRHSGATNIANFSRSFFIQLILAQGILILLLVLIAMKAVRYAVYLAAAAGVMAFVAVATGVTDVGLLVGETLPFYAVIFILTWKGALPMRRADKPVIRADTSRLD
jgi:hypothetical protein